MRTESQVSLLPYNTFGIDAETQLLITLENEDDVYIAFKEYPKGMIIGGGSNILLSRSNYEVVIINRIKGKEVVDENHNDVIISIGSGENWHEIVLWSLEQGFGGLENLSLIPGTIGAAPIQNIGAYGIELKDVLYGVDFYKYENNSVHFVPAIDCNLKYRDSVFKNEWKHQGFISRVYLKLTSHVHKTNTSYHALEQYLNDQGWLQPSIQQISKAVIAIRESKLPDWRKIGNAGSFFKNPIIPSSSYKLLKAKYPNAPSFPIDASNVKIPAAWLIQEAGFKGKRMGQIGTYEFQPLVLVNYGGGTAAELLQLKENIQTAVENQFGIRLTPEVTIL